MNLAEIGPILTAAVAFISWSESCFQGLSVQGCWPSAPPDTLKAPAIRFRGARGCAALACHVHPDPFPVVRAGRYLQGPSHATKRFTAPWRWSTFRAFGRLSSMGQLPRRRGDTCNPLTNGTPIVCPHATGRTAAPCRTERAPRWTRCDRRFGTRRRTELGPPRSPCTRHICREHLQRHGPACGSLGTVPVIHPSSDWKCSHDVTFGPLSW